MSKRISETMLLDPEVIDDPYPFYRQLRDQAPVWEVSGTGLFTVATFELVAEATARFEDFSSNLSCLLYRDEAGLPSRLSYGDAGVQVLATADPPLHALHRSTVFPELVAKRMEQLEPDIVELANRCVTHALDLGTADFMAVAGNVVPITMISRLIGFHDVDIDQLLTAAFDSTAMLGSTLSLEELMALVGGIADVQTWIDGQLADAMKHPDEDLLGAIARGVESGALSEFEANGILLTLLSAGGESTTSLLGNAVRFLAEDQDLQLHIRRHPELIPTFAEEVLRLEPPFRYHMRSTLHDTSLGGVDIPADSTVLLLWGAATATPPSTSDPTRSTSNGERPATIWPSGAASTTA